MNRASKYLIGWMALMAILVWFGQYGVVQALPEGLATANPRVREEVIAAATDDDVARRESVSIHYTQEEEAAMKAGATRHVFDAEVGKLMKIIINSLYSNKEIFLRELISNASDALDKLRYLALTNSALMDTNPRLEIRISYDGADKTVTIRDTGIGMTRKELEENLGTIARSGTEQFVRSMSDGGSESLIGQFGVGFYSAFLVANRVTVTSKSNDDDTQWVWDSDGASDFTLTEDPKGNTLGRGTRIVLHMKEGEDFDEFMRQDRLKAIIERYSEFIGYQIYLHTSSMEDVPAPQNEEDEEAVVEEETGVDAADTITQTVWKWELVNDPRVPIWRRAKAENSLADYHNFYQSLTNDDAPPVVHDHFKAEGDVEFSAILYVPEDSNKDRGDEMRRGPRLYVRRVFITDNWQFLIPRYMDFIKGVVDSDDLPLNVSREMLQQHKTLEAIKKKLVRKAIQMFQDLANASDRSAEDRERWERFWQRYAGNLKLGVIEDMLNRSRLAKLVRFHTSHTGATLSGLDDVVARMKPGQKNLFFLASDSLAQAQNSPLLEAFAKRGVEVIFSLAPIDEYMFLNLGRYDHKYQLVNIGVENFDVDAVLKEVPLDDEDAAASAADDVEALSPEDVTRVTEFFQSTLGAKVSKVKESKLLTKSPCALVSGMFGMSASMRKVMKQQQMAKGKRSGDMPAEVDMETKVLELNLNHPLVRKVATLTETDPNSAAAARIVSLLYNTASISSGFEIEDEKDFVQTIHDMMSHYSSV